MFNDEVSDFVGNFKNNLGDYIHRSSVSPILSALDGLGKEDMASLAEALVDIASLKLRVSKRTEVVGRACRCCNFIKG